VDGDGNEDDLVSNNNSVHKNKNSDKSKKISGETAASKRYNKQRKNQQYCYYFKLPELLILFYKALRMRVYLEEVYSLKNQLIEILVNFF
jgi:hypothetical protein